MATLSIVLDNAYRGDTASLMSLKHYAKESMISEIREIYSAIFVHLTPDTIPDEPDVTFPDSHEILADAALDTLSSIMQERSLPSHIITSWGSHIWPWMEHMVLVYADERGSHFRMGIYTSILNILGIMLRSYRSTVLSSPNFAAVYTELWSFDLLEAHNTGISADMYMVYSKCSGPFIQRFLRNDGPALASCLIRRIYALSKHPTSPGSLELLAHLMLLRDNFPGTPDTQFALSESEHVKVILRVIQHIVPLNKNHYLLLLHDLGVDAELASMEQYRLQLRTCLSYLEEVLSDESDPLGPEPDDVLSILERADILHSVYRMVFIECPPSTDPSGQHKSLKRSFETLLSAMTSCLIHRQCLTPKIEEVAQEIIGNSIPLWKKIARVVLDNCMVKRHHTTLPRRCMNEKVAVPYSNPPPRLDLITFQCRKPKQSDDPDIQICKSCRVMEYCSPVCQQNDWIAGHNSTCSPAQTHLENYLDLSDSADDDDDSDDGNDKVHPLHETFLTAASRTLRDDTSFILRLIQHDYCNNLTTIAHLQKQFQQRQLSPPPPRSPTTRSRSITDSSSSTSQPKFPVLHMDYSTGSMKLSVHPFRRTSDDVVICDNVKIDLARRGVGDLILYRVKRLGFMPECGFVLVRYSDCEFWLDK